MHIKPLKASNDNVLNRIALQAFYGSVGRIKILTFVAFKKKTEDSIKVKRT